MWMSCTLAHQHNPFPNQANVTIQPTDEAKYGRIPLLFRRRVHSTSKVTQGQSKTSWIGNLWIMISRVGELRAHAGNLSYVWHCLEIGQNMSKQALHISCMQVILSSTGLHLFPQRDHSPSGWFSIIRRMFQNHSAFIHQVSNLALLALTIAHLVIAPEREGALRLKSCF